MQTFLSRCPFYKHLRVRPPPVAKVGLAVDSSGNVFVAGSTQSTNNFPTTNALQAYYQGIGSIRANGVYASTKQYSAAVQALRVRFRSDHTGR